MAHADASQCWVLAEEAKPHKIIDASSVWLATWMLEGTDVIGIKSPNILNGVGHDAEAGQALMRQFYDSGNNNATQRCRNTRSDGQFTQSRTQTPLPAQQLPLLSFLLLHSHMAS